MAMAKQPKTAAVGSAQFKARCLELIEHVREANAEYVVTRHGVPVARLVPFGASQPVSFLGSMAGSVLKYDNPFAPVPGAWTVDRNDSADEV